MRIAQINVVASLSTGRIAVSLCRTAMQAGHRALICHSRDHAPADVPSYVIGSKAETLLDLGCGTGLELDEIFRLHPDIRVTGIDLAPGMLARLREKHPERKLTLTVGDYLTVPLAPCAFDVAVAFETLHHFPPETKLGLFRRIFAALRPGGMLLEGDYIAESDEMETYLFQELARRRARQHVPEGTFVHFDTPLTLAHELSLLSQAGFTAEVLGYRGEDNTPMIRAIKP